MSYKSYEHTLKPYYDYEISETIPYSCFEKHMYLMNPRRAKQLVKLGVPIYIVEEYGRNQVRVNHPYELQKITCVCGVEKKDWQDFLHTEKGAAFIHAWEDVANMAQHVNIETGLREGKFASDYYELLYAEETSEIENYFDERFDYLGDEPKSVRSFKKNIAIYFPLIIEYAARLTEMYVDAGVKGLDEEFFLNELIGSFEYFEKI